MAKQIKSEEIVEKDLFKDLRESAKQTEAVIISLESSLTLVANAAKQMKSTSPKDSPTNSKGITATEIAFNVYQYLTDYDARS